MQIIRQLKIQKRSDLVTKGKKADVLLFNSGNEPLTISQIDIIWPSGNGNLVEVLFGANNTIYDTPNLAPPDFSVDPVIPVTITDWEAGADLTIDPGEGLKLGFFFQRKTKDGTVAEPYDIRVSLQGAITTEIVQVFDPAPAPLHVNANGGSAVDFGGGDGLTEATLEPVLDQAIAYWAGQGVDSHRLESVAGADVHVADISGSVLGLAYLGANRIQIDRDAAGFVWDNVDLLSPSPCPLPQIIRGQVDHHGSVLHANDLGEREPTWECRVSCIRNTIESQKSLFISPL